jgi:hypothetical protein
MFAYTKLMQAMSGAAAVVSDAFFNLVTLLLNTGSTNGAQNNTFLDSSTNNFTITRNGNTTQGTFTPFSQTGWSNYFNGSSYLQTPSSTNYAFGTGDFTIEAFFFPTATTANLRLFEFSDNNDNIGANSGSTGTVAYFNGSTNTVSVGTPFTANQWNHVAVVRSSGTVTVYVNGTSALTQASTPNTTSARSVGIAGISNTYFPGYVSNVRILKGTAQYTATFTPPTAPLTAITNTQLLTCQSNRFIDNSTNAVTLTIGSAPQVQAFSPFAPTAAYDTAVVGGSGYFDGSGDYLTLSPGSAFAFGTGDFTVEAWIYPTSGPGDKYIIEARNSGQTNTWSLGFAYSGVSNQLDWGYNGSVLINGGTNVKTNQWNHVVYCRSGTTGSIFVNGSRISTITDSTNYSVSPTTSYIGARYSADYNYQGYMSARVVKGTAVYDPTQTTLTVPTSPATAITNTSLLLNFTNSGIYDSTAKNVLETVGNAQVSTTQAKWGTTSMYFDGSGDGLIGPVSNLFDFGSGDFCVEFWANIPSTSGTGYFVSVWEDAGGSDANSSWLIRLNNNGTLITHLTQGSSTFNTLTSGTLSTNTWFHCAYTRSGNTIYLFIDGVLAQSASVSGAMNTVVRALRVGYQSGGSVLTGYLDDLRITKGNARYTATFTPPTAAFPIQ